MSDVPADAITAAARVIHDANCTCGDYEAHIIKPVNGDWPLRVARLALEAAAPALRAQGAAAERERIRDLAEQHNAECQVGTEPCGCSMAGCSAERPVMGSFADLLDGGGDD